MTTITTHGQTFEIEGDHYEGDLLLLSPDRDIRIVGGYEEMKQHARLELGIPDRVTGDFEVEKYQVRYFVETHISEYIEKNFEQGVVTEH